MTIYCICLSVQDKVESLQERLDAYVAGDKTTDSLDIPDGAVKAKRCKYVAGLHLFLLLVYPYFP